MNNRDLIQFLNKLLSNYFVLYIKLHRYHWYVKGVHFYQLHREFEKMHHSVREDFEKIAKQILVIDGQPLATMIKYIKETSLTEASADNLVCEMVDQLISDFEQVKSEINEEGIMESKKINHETTTNMLVLLQDKLEEYLWMLKTYTQQE